MAFRPLTTSNNSGPSRKISISERNAPSHHTSSSSSSINTSTARRDALSARTVRSVGGAVSATSSSSTNKDGGAQNSAVTTAAAAEAAQEELSKQHTLQSEIDLLERELWASRQRSEQHRRRVHAQADSQARLIADGELWMAKKGRERAKNQKAFDAEQMVAEKERERTSEVQRVAEGAAAEASARCGEALRQREEATEQLRMMKKSIEHRNSLITQEGTKQEDIKAQLALVEAEIAILEQKKREQIERMDELKAKVERTKQLELDALNDLEQRKQVLVKLQRDIDALKKIRRGH